MSKDSKPTAKKARQQPKVSKGWQKAKYIKRLAINNKLEAKISKAQLKHKTARK